MTWRWVFPADLPDADLAAEAEAGWPDRAAAEAWLQEVFPDLVDLGLHQATLTEDGAGVYTMGLDE